ncbi:hypothetical protein QJS10_CPB17g01689 [Acorus calamus]|uniref:Ribosomal protein S6 n=1 Tax=Acorus calamus TaxID=4465 RepID=A0AAV9CW79_ACOCL|nr:hypothetical protein QJS10_CPB17g01689 [Acorus calamus]
MPLYDCMLLLKPTVERVALMDLVAQVGRHVYHRNGVITDIKSFGRTFLGYAIKKRDGRFYKGQLMQMTMMVPPSFNKELHYLNKEDRLLRWLLVKHKNTVYGLDFMNDDDGKHNLLNYPKSGLYNTKDRDEDDEDDDEDEEQCVEVTEETK